MLLFFYDKNINEINAFKTKNTSETFLLDNSDPDDSTNLLLPQGAGTLFGKSHLRVNELNRRPCGQSPDLIFIPLLH